MSNFPLEGLATTVQSEPPSVTLGPFTGVPTLDTLSSPFGWGVNGAGNAGTSVAPVIWNRGVIGVAVQLLSKQPRPNVCWSDARSE